MFDNKQFDTMGASCEPDGQKLLLLPGEDDPLRKEIAFLKQDDIDVRMLKKKKKTTLMCKAIEMQ